MNVFKQTYENPQNKLQKDLALKRWPTWLGTLLTRNNTAVFQQVNPDHSEERDLIQMIRVDEYTEINVYLGKRGAEGDNVDPDTPVKIVSSGRVILQ